MPNSALPRAAPGPSGSPRLPIKPSPFGISAEQAPNILAQVEEATRRVNQLLSDGNQQRLVAAIDNLARWRRAGSVNTLTQRLTPPWSSAWTRPLAALPPLAGDVRKPR